MEGLEGVFSGDVGLRSVRIDLTRFDVGVVVSSVGASSESLTRFRGISVKKRKTASRKYFRKKLLRMLLHLRLQFNLNASLEGNYYVGAFDNSRSRGLVSTA